MAKKHEYGSFDYKIINENIRNVLDARSQLDNTVQLSMPFVKATTTVQHEYLGNDNVGFTLGLHGVDQDVTYESMYAVSNQNIFAATNAGQTKNSPLLGYTYNPNGNTELVYSPNPFDQDSLNIAKIFDRQASLVTYPNESEFIRIPPPGITNATIGRNKNGLLASAQIQISVPSLTQLEALHRLFLVPGMGMILEWGQQFAPYPTNEKFLQKPDITQHLFPWNNRSELLTILQKLQKREVGLSDILEDYVYPSHGQYMWMFGRVANFKVNSNSDGSFNVSVRIVGPSEDSWAYSTTTTVVPRKDPSADYFCASDAHSVFKYFSDTVSGGLNLKTLLDKTLRGEGYLSDWKEHVQFFEQGNKQYEGEPQPGTQTPTVDQKTFADSEDAYFMTWRFFVNVVINGTDDGIKAIFRRAGIDSQKLATIGLLLPYADGNNRTTTDIGKLKVIDDPKESFVGCNKYLRSIDPSVLIIVNDLAADLAAKNPQYNIPANKDELIEETNESKKFKKATVNFENSAKTYAPNPSDPDRAFLSSGVWLNHKAVVEAMLNGDTILRGVTNLLERMNTATSKFWSLTLDAIDGDKDNPHPHSYTVVDANRRESSDRAVSEFIDNVHIFNKYIRRKNDGTLVGSELIECSVDLSLPKLMFSQIATMGLLSQTEVVSSSLGPPATEEEKSDSIKISDPNDTLAKMFGVTSVAVKNGNGQYPDLTHLPNIDQKSTCGKTNVQTIAGTGGQGHQAGGTDLRDISGLSQKDLESKYSGSVKALQSDNCKACNSCLDQTTVPTTAVSTPQSTSTPRPTPAPTAPPGLFTPVQPKPPQTSGPSSATDKKLSELTIGEILAVQRPKGAVLAVGKYQAIPVTFQAWVRATNQKESTVFSPQVQESLGTWLLTNKRPKVGRFINGDTSVSVEDAQLELAKEFASLPVPSTNPNAKKGYYDGIAGNRASVSSGQLQRVLLDARKNKSVAQLKEFIAKGEGNYDAINRGRAGDTTTYSTNYYQALSGRGSPSNPSDATTVTTRSSGASSGTSNSSSSSSSCKESFSRIGGGNESRGKSICTECARHKQLVERINKVNEVRKNVDEVLRKFSGLRKVFRYVEVFPELMVASITGDANGIKSNAFGASPGPLSIAGDITMPGINGIRVGELFWIDRIPAFYRAFGAFQVMSVEDTIDINGWKTKIHSRFNYLGAKWKNTMAEKLNSR